MAQGAIMAVPAHDDKDFYSQQNLIFLLFKSLTSQVLKAHREDKTGVMIQFPHYQWNACQRCYRIHYSRKLSVGSRRINFKMRDANFSRQKILGRTISYSL